MLQIQNRKMIYKNKKNIHNIMKSKMFNKKSDISNMMTKYNNNKIMTKNYIKIREIGFFLNMI